MVHHRIVTKTTARLFDTKSARASYLPRPRRFLPLNFLVGKLSIIHTINCAPIFRKSKCCTSFQSVNANSISSAQKSEIKWILTDGEIKNLDAV